MEVEKKITLDLLDVTAPALSSTDDLPKVETKPDASPAAPKPEAPKPEEGKKPAESAPAEQPEEPSASDEPEGKPKAKGVQKRLDELLRRAGEAERLAEVERQEKLRLLALLESKDKPKADPKPDETDEPVKPQRSAFVDKPDEYEAAMDEYITAKSSALAKKAVNEALAEQDRKTQQKTIEDGQKAARDVYAGRVKAASEKYPDYQSVAESPDVVVSIPMAHAIVHSEHGPDIAYHLGKNPDEAKRISELAPPLQLVELGLIVAKLNAPAATPAPKEAAKPPVSNAPKPIKPLGAGSEKLAKSPEEESMEEYAARRKKELNERRPGTRH